MAALIFAGLYFTIATRFVQFVRPKEMLKLMISGGEETRGTGHISPFQAFAISTAARVGTGNIAGVAIAITVGGPGAIFGCGSLRLSAPLPLLPKARWPKSIK